MHKFSVSPIFSAQSCYFFDAIAECQRHNFCIEGVSRDVPCGEIFAPLEFEGLADMFRPSLERASDVLLEHFIETDQDLVQRPACS